MSRKHIPTPHDYYKVKRKTQLTRVAKATLVLLYGITPVDCTVDNLPFLKPDTWMNDLRISPSTMNQLYEKGMVERKSMDNYEWAVRLTEKGFNSVIAK